MGLKVLTLILVLHFLADYVLQTNWMAQGKSRRFGLNLNMASHIGVYTACLMPLGWVWALANGAAHCLTDAISSNAAGYLWRRDERHWFFVVVGADQLAHYLCLTWSFGWLGRLT